MTHGGIRDTMTPGMLERCVGGISTFPRGLLESRAKTDLAKIFPVLVLVSMVRWSDINSTASVRLLRSCKPLKYEDSCFIP